MIDGKVYAINRARMETRHSQEIATLRRESRESGADSAMVSAMVRRLMEENALMRALLSEVMGATVDGAAVTISMHPSWHDQVRALVGGRVGRIKKNRKKT